MKIYRITEQELQTLANVLGEIPAKQVIGVIDMLRGLPVIDEVVTEKPQVEEK